MATPEETIKEIVAAPTWDQRVALIRLIAQRHGTGDHQRIYAEVAREAYVPHLSPDFAYIHESEFYEPETFRAAYVTAEGATNGFVDIDEAQLSQVLKDSPKTLLVFRTMLGLAKTEFAQATLLVDEEEKRNQRKQGRFHGKGRQPGHSTDRGACGEDNHAGDGRQPVRRSTW